MTPLARLREAWERWTEWRKVAPAAEPKLENELSDAISALLASAPTLTEEERVKVYAALQTGVLLAGDFRSLVKTTAGNPRAITPMIREMQAALRILDKFMGGV